MKTNLKQPKPRLAYATILSVLALSACQTTEQTYIKNTKVDQNNFNQTFIRKDWRAQSNSYRKIDQSAIVVPISRSFNNTEYKNNKSSYNWLPITE